MPSTLTITDLDVAFGARTLFTGLDLTLADGDVTAVVGPNGSGKSTLMRTIIGELPVEHGSIELARGTRRSPGCRSSSRIRRSHCWPTLAGARGCRRGCRLGLQCRDGLGDQTMPVCR